LTLGSRRDEYHFVEVENCDVRRLKGTQGCRLRIGDWRVIFIEDTRSITVVAVGHRREIYD
jgi:mRNA interferase RelE/StbE